MLNNLLHKIYNRFSNHIGIDLGTANTLVYIQGTGVIINEPSVVALNVKTGRVVAVGKDAKEMLGRNPSHIKIVRPLVDGVISDFDVTEEMLAYFIRKAEKSSRRFFRPRVVIGVPSGITNVEHRAVYDAARNAGAREVYIIEEPMAAAIGLGLPILDAVGSMIIDIGGGTTDIAVISLGGVVQSKNLKIAGDKLNQDIISYLRDEFKVSVGEKTAEDIKIKIGVIHNHENLESEVRGRDVITGLPRQILVNNHDIREAIYFSIENLIDGTKEVLEKTPPEIVSDVMQRGIYLVGGGALIGGLDELLSQELDIPVYISETPLLVVSHGTGAVFEDIDLYKQVLIHQDDELPLR
ncbi:MAG: rod shape-determining protein [Candidatus Pacebacteria bacterium]|nr:rod shape-determining protein [Candidatus Paceibacterota bacterium]